MPPSVNGISVVTYRISVNYCLFALITLKDMSYESSKLKPKRNKIAEKKEKFGYQGHASREKNSEWLDAREDW